MGALYLRPVLSADLNSIVELEQRAFRDPWPRLAFRQFTEATGFLLAVDPELSDDQRSTRVIDGTLAGYIVATPATNQADTVHIRNLAVAPAYRRRGLATKLITVALGQFDSSVYEMVYLEVRASNTGAIELYRSLGFAVASRASEYYPDGEDALIMERTLEQDETE